jgi:hypothetical protein
MCFPLTNFSNGKQTQESLESGFPESEFRETNMALVLSFCQASLALLLSVWVFNFMFSTMES